MRINMMIIDLGDIHLTLMSSLLTSMQPKELGRKIRTSLYTPLLHQGLEILTRMQVLIILHTMALEPNISFMNQSILQVGQCGQMMHDSKLVFQDQIQ
jgi:hypothetical protein